MSEETKEISQNQKINNPEPQVKEYTAGEMQTGTVTGITSFGAFVRLPDGTEGLVHISEVANTYVTNIENFLSLNQEVKVKILGKNKKGKYDLSIKQIDGNKNTARQSGAGFSDGQNKKDNNFELGSFDELLHNFLKRSDEIQLDVRRNLQYKQGVKKKGKGKKKLKEI